MGNNVQPVPVMGSAKGRRWKAIPDRIIPALGQLSENGSKPPIKERWAVFHDAEIDSQFANESEKLTPKSGAVTVETGGTFSSRGPADVLTRETAGKHPNASDSVFPKSLV